MTRTLSPRTLALAAFAALVLAAVHARILSQSPHLRSLATMNAAAANTDEHTYFRPPAAETGGFPNNTRKYHRAPCPCMNTLANHGYFPRDGKNLTPQIVRDAIIEVFNIEPGLAARLSAALPPTFTLADLGEHNFIEHDASLVHDDAYFGRDPSLVNVTLADDLFARAGDDQLLTARILGQFRGDRERECARTNPQYDFSAKRQGAAYIEAAALLLAAGDYDSETISVKDARSFLVDERLPDGFQRSETPVTSSTALYLGARIKFFSFWPWSAVATA